MSLMSISHCMVVATGIHLHIMNKIIEGSGSCICTVVVAAPFNKLFKGLGGDNAISLVISHGNRMITIAIYRKTHVCPNQTVAAFLVNLIQFCFSNILWSTLPTLLQNIPIYVDVFYKVLYCTMVQE